MIHTDPLSSLPTAPGLDGYAQDYTGVVACPSLRALLCVIAVHRTLLCTLSHTRSSRTLSGPRVA